MLTHRLLRARSALVAAMIGSALVAPFGSVARAQGLWFATWKVDLAKSTYPAGPPAFKSMTCRIESWEEKVRVTYRIIGTRGDVTHIEWIGSFDGRDYPVAGIDGYVITHAYRRVDDRTFDVVQKTEGSGTSTARMTISTDGRTLTTLTPGANSRDPAQVTVTVYNRQ
jgi:hypothetical protein